MASVQGKGRQRRLLDKAPANKVLEPCVVSDRVALEWLCHFRFEREQLQEESPPCICATKKIDEDRDRPSLAYKLYH